MDQPSTSSAIKEDQIEAENIGFMTTKMLKRMIRKLQLDHKSSDSIPINDPVSRTARYTGMTKNNIEKILAFGEFHLGEYKYVEIDRTVIHRTLINMYLDHNHIPTITELFNSLTNKLPIYIDIDYLTTILIRMGYVFYKFPGCKSLRVMEKKTVTFERYRYLKSIQQYRQNYVPIVYIGFASFDNSMNFINLERTLQTDTKNIISYVLFTASNKEIDNVKVIPATTSETLKDIVKDWLLEIFTLKNLAPGIVCVLEDSEIFRETLSVVPTWKSVKADMVEWLEEHNIPCHIDMPKADLLQLIETCTDTNENTFVIDNLIKTYNYPLLRLPQCINGLSIVPLLINFLNNEYQGKVFDKSVPAPGKRLHNVSVSHLRSFSTAVKGEEKQMLEDDIKVDNALDGLIRKIKMSKIVVENNEDDTAIPTFSDSD